MEGVGGVGLEGLSKGEREPRTEATAAVREGDAHIDADGFAVKLGELEAQANADALFVEEGEGLSGPCGVIATEDRSCIVKGDKSDVNGPEIEWEAAVFEVDAKEVLAFKDAAEITAQAVVCTEGRDAAVDIVAPKLNEGFEVQTPDTPQRTDVVEVGLEKLIDPRVGKSEICAFLDQRLEACEGVHSDLQEITVDMPAIGRARKGFKKVLIEVIEILGNAKLGPEGRTEGIVFAECKGADIAKADELGVSGVVSDKGVDRGFVAREDRFAHPCAGDIVERERFGRCVAIVVS